MSNAAEPNHPGQKLFDRMVDGELSDQERRSLLEWCDQETDGWKRLAMAYMESQALTQAMNELLKESPQSALSQKELTMSSPYEPQTTVQRKVPPRNRPISKHPHLSKLLMVLGIVCALGAGWMSRDLTTDKPDNVTQMLPADENGIRGTVELQVGNEHYEELPSTMWASLRHSETGPKGNIEIPLISEQDYNQSRSTREVEQVSRELQDSLSRVGLNLTQSWNYLPMRLKDGRTIIVPIENVQVKSNSKPAGWQ